MTKDHVKISVSELKENAKNPKMHDDKLIKQSISDLGFVDDVVIDENNVILGGHGRLKALRDLGIMEVDAIRITGWTDAQKEQYLLVSNKATSNGSWNQDLLKLFDKSLLEATGFAEKEMEKIFEEKIEQVAEVEFSEELMLEHNYVVLYFDNLLDWQVAVDKLGLKVVKSIAPDKSQKIGIGRVINGKDIIAKL